LVSIGIDREAEREKGGQIRAKQRQTCSFDRETTNKQLFSLQTPEETMPKVQPETVTGLLMLGISPPQISRALKISKSTVYRYCATEREDWIPAEKPTDVWKGSRARTAQLLASFGIPYKVIAAYMGCTQRTVINYVNHTQPCGEPLLYIKTTHDVVSENREVVEPQIYRVADLDPSVALVHVDGQGKSNVYFVQKERLRGVVQLPTESETLEQHKRQGARNAA